MLLQKEMHCRLTWFCVTRQGYISLKTRNNAFYVFKAAGRLVLCRFLFIRQAGGIEPLYTCMEIISSALIKNNFRTKISLQDKYIPCFKFPPVFIIFNRKQGSLKGFSNSNHSISGGRNYEEKSGCHDICCSYDRCTYSMWKQECRRTEGRVCKNCRNRSSGKGTGAGR